MGIQRAAITQQFCLLIFNWQVRFILFMIGNCHRAGLKTNEIWDKLDNINRKSSCCVLAGKKQGHLTKKNCAQIVHLSDLLCFCLHKYLVLHLIHFYFYSGCFFVLIKMMVVVFMLLLDLYEITM